jgi:sulfatase maturation enzyme AslB (radical SAM superfamily)
MDISVAKEAITRYMEEDGADMVEINFFGGEPLLASYKMEVMASCLIEWERLRNKLKNMDSLSPDDVVQAKARLDAIGEYIENPIQ